MHTWHWHTWQGLPYLTCSLLQDWQHGFFTQQFWTRSPAELVNILHPGANVYRVKQVHGNTVLSASEIEQTIASQVLASPENTASENIEADTRQFFPDADGLLTESNRQAVWVCTADCTPVLIADESTGQVAAIHAGWRGTALKIVPAAVERMRSHGSQLQHLRVAMGPAIAGSVYQVSTAVAAQVGATIVNRPVTIPVGVMATSLTAPDPDMPDLNESHDTILSRLKNLPNPPILDDPQPGRARLDVRRINALQLESIGIAPEQMAIAPYCTYQSPDLFFSYRRSRQKKVQWSGIVSNGIY